MVVMNLSNPEKIAELGAIFYQAIKPPPILGLHEWSDKYRILTSESSAEPGPWRTSRFPFTREIMECLSPQHPATEVVWMAGAQIAKTEVSLNFMGYTIHYSPAPMLYAQKTIDAVKRFSKQRLSKMIAAMPVLRNRLTKIKSRDSENTQLIKNFMGGILILAGANSAASLRSLPMERAMLDEIDSYESDIDEEGDPVELAVRRTANFSRRKIYKASTPGVKETSRIEPAFEAGDQRYYHVPCPHCGKFQKIIWDSIKWDDEDPKTARMVCVQCNKDIPERFKTQMLEAGKWIAVHPGRSVVSFHLSALYSPLGFFSWADAVELWLKYTRSRDAALLKVFVNTVLGETWSEAGKTVDYTGLQKRCGVGYPKREEKNIAVPAGALILTAGVDVQDDRLEIEVCGFGENEESWSIDYALLWGDTEGDDVWKDLDQYLAMQWKHESGHMLRLAGVAVDSGFRARKVYNFCGPREYRRIFPIKGMDGFGKPLIDRPMRRTKDGLYLFIANVDEIKSKIYSQLSISTPGPGYCHFPKGVMYDGKYFQGLTSEKLIPKLVNGKKRLAWELPPGKRNEPLDCRAYAIAALNILNPRFEAIRNRGIPFGAVQVERPSGPSRSGVLSSGVKI